MDTVYDYCRICFPATVILRIFQDSSLPCAPLLQLPQLLTLLEVFTDFLSKRMGRQIVRRVHNPKNEEFTCVEL